MRRRSFLAFGAATSAAAVLGTGTSATAAVRSATANTANTANDPDSLRALAAKINLRIGTALIPQDIETPTYAAIAGSQFSVVTPGNAMKWQIVEPTQGGFDWSQADQLVAFAQANKQLIRGHTLLWHNQLPDWLTTGVSNGSISNSQLFDLLHQHIITEVTRFRGKIWQWDVANEFFLDANPSGINPNDFWVSHLGPGIIPQAFRWAHEADPHAILVYNDYNIAGEDGSNAKSDAVFAWLKQMLAEGVPIHGVGNQGHLDTQFGFSPQRFQQDLERYASLGLKVAITEADVRTFVNNATEQVPTDNLALFAQPYEFSQMLKAALAVPECISFTVWGFTDADSWVPGFFTGEGYATIYDVNQQPKQAYFDMQQDLQLAAHGAPHHG
ncbi:MAG TPA: endo-1,4-beta-xylanase [Streptosporangiaceae bacterium]|nr:endo-1,4-beta-xylanase [Streptosporangiaceae bacterium]